MTKIRYYKLRIPRSSNLELLTSAARELGTQNGFVILESTSENLVLKCAISRLIETTQILSDGSEVKSRIPTIDQYMVRFFQPGGVLMLALLDPPRGSRVTMDILGKLLGSIDYFIDSLEINPQMIRGHIATFDSSRLVSAKIRDFKVYDNAIGRLEISSKDGLIEEIAPFLAGKYYRVDSLTYEVTHQFKRGLVCYSSSGTIKVSAPLVEIAFPTFELSL